MGELLQQMQIVVISILKVAMVNYNFIVEKLILWIMENLLKLNTKMEKSLSELLQMSKVTKQKPQQWIMELIRALNGLQVKIVVQ